MGFMSFTKPDNKPKSIRSISSYIDKLYDNKTVTRIDSLINFSFDSSNSLTKLTRSRYILTHYSKGNITKCYSHLGFTFYVFKERRFAKEQFIELIQLAKPKSMNAEWDKFLDLFSKGGCTYTLYENTIICQALSCGYNKPKDKPKVDKLLGYIFDNHFPTDTFFLGVYCGWKNIEIK